MGLTEIVTGGGIVAALLFVLKKFLDRGASKNVQEKARNLAAKKEEAKAKRERDEVSQLQYEQEIKSLEEDEKRLKKEIKNADEIEVPDSDVDDASADELADRLSEYTS